MIGGVQLQRFLQRLRAERVAQYGCATLSASLAESSHNNILIRRFIWQEIIYPLTFWFT
jgi:hypothetical protein